MELKSILQFNLRYKGMMILLAFTLLAGIFLYQKTISVRKEVEAIYADNYVSTGFVTPKSEKIIFVGDIMLDRGVETAINEYGGGDYGFPFSKIAGYLSGADLTVGNLEGPVSDKGYNVGSIYSFRDDPKAIDGLKSAGFDLVSLANNHMFDYTGAALKDTFIRLKDAGIGYAGAGLSKEEALEPKIMALPGGAKIALLAFSNLGPKSWEAQTSSAGLAWLNQENLESSIAKARTEADIVAVMFHWGDEYQNLSNDEQKRFARLAIDSGADLVVGHHPHVAQEMEQYKGKYIAYSLGNFVFDQSFSKETMEGLALEVSVQNK
ncbi:MAG: CapA family protein, partial [Candidatus Paceibacterota bacterium]